MAIKYNIRVWLGRYESFVLKLYGRERFYFVDTHLERFLSFFPNNLGIESFTITDIADYRISRIRAGVNRSTIEIELRCVRNFFKWMIEDCELPLFNPVKPDGHVVLHTTKSRLRLDDLKRLLEVADVRFRKWILEEISGEPHDGTLHGRWLYATLREAALAANLEWLVDVSVFRQAMQGLWWKIIEKAYPELKAAFTDEAPVLTAEQLEEALLAESEAFNSQVLS